MFVVSITLKCDRCEGEFQHEVEPTLLVTDRVPAWDARQIVQAAERQGWEVTRCSDCLDVDEYPSEEDMMDDGDHRRDERAIRDHLNYTSSP